MIVLVLASPYRCCIIQLQKESWSLRTVMKKMAQTIVPKFYNLFVSPEDIATWRKESTVLLSGTNDEDVSMQIVELRVAKLIGPQGSNPPLLDFVYKSEVRFVFLNMPAPK